MTALGNTPLNSPMRDKCPRSGKYCWCAAECKFKTPEEIARAARSDEPAALPRREWTPLPSTLFMDELDALVIAGEAGLWDEINGEA